MNAVPQSGGGSIAAQTIGLAAELVAMVARSSRGAADSTVATRLTGLGGRVTGRAAIPRV